MYVQEGPPSANDGIRLKGTEANFQHEPPLGHAGRFSFSGVRTAGDAFFISCASRILRSGSLNSLATEVRTRSFSLGADLASELFFGLPTPPASPAFFARSVVSIADLASRKSFATIAR